MIRRLRTLSLLSFAAASLVSSGAFAAQFEPVADYGGSTAMNIYVPDNVDASPGVVVALHSCGNQYESDSQNYVKTSADQYGFIIIQPTNGNPDCWTADAGQDGEKPNIVKMVEYVIENHNADASRVYAMGASSGACMTLALMATHPDVFKAGAVLAGVPYGAWSAGGSCSVCSQQPTSKSDVQWGDTVRQNAPANYAGPWPRIQLWHGNADDTLLFGWMAESEKQWKNVHGLTAAGTAAANPPAGWARTEYAQDGVVVLQVNSGAGKDHYLPDDVPQAEVVKFFGLDMDVTPGETGGDTSGVVSETVADSSGADGSSEATSSTTTTSAPTSTETTSTPSNTTTATPPPASNPPVQPSAPTPTPVTPTPSTTSSTATGTDSTPTTSATGTDTGTSPVQATDNGGESGCQCEFGATRRPNSLLVGLLLAGIAAIARRRSRA
jgi:poly(hydroxyalkanoate) depolymerase family esterase